MRQHELVALRTPHALRALDYSPPTESNSSNCRRHRAERSEAAAVDRAGAQRLNGGQVLGRPVALVLGKTVAGIEPVKLAHEAVARHLRQDARAGNRVTARIAFHQRCVRESAWI